MIDIHSHILPGVDDGSDDIALSIRMVQEAYRQGFLHIVATPHFSDQFRRVERQRLCDLLEEIRQRVPECVRGEVELSLGQEMLWSERSRHYLKEGRVLTMGDTDYLLVEFFPNETKYEIEKAVRELTMLGYRPLIAHVERYLALDAGSIDALIGQGARIQMNFASPAGGILDRRSSYCKSLLKEGLIHFMGTDMHNMTDRKPETAKALSWMKRNLNPDYMDAICGGNAERMLRGERIEP